VLDLNTGVLEYCNAGHDRPYVVPHRGGLVQLADGAGPPLCALDGFDYEAVTRRLERGDMLCLITDGVTDARNPAGELFGRPRLEQRLSALGADAGTPALVTARLSTDVEEFVAGGEAADDLAILVVRWDGRPVLSGR